MQVSQEELEAYDGVPAGKYTAGLGQASAVSPDGWPLQRRRCSHLKHVLHWLVQRSRFVDRQLGSDP